MVNNAPRTSVIIPNYNHSIYLPQRIESVLNQSFQDIEVILLDDCSPDNSREVIERYAAQDARIRVVYNKQNSGSTFKQWNKGFALARGQYIWIAESDDYADPYLLESLVQELDNDAEVGLAYCNSATVDENNNSISVLDNFYSELDPHLWTQDFVVEGRKLITNFMSYRNIIPNASAVVIRKRVIDKIGKANENFRVNGDWIFWASIISDTKVSFVARKLNYFRFHTNNVRSRTLKNGINISEMAKAVYMMQQYGKPNPVFLHKMMFELMSMWYNGFLANAIPLKTHIKIFKSLKIADRDFNAHLKEFLKENLITINWNRLKQFLGDGFLYKAFRH